MDIRSTHIYLRAAAVAREKMMKNLFATKKEDKGKRKICDERNWNILISQTFNKQSKWSKKVAVEEEEVGIISRCIVIESTNVASDHLLWLTGLQIFIIAKFLLGAYRHQRKNINKSFKLKPTHYSAIKKYKSLICRCENKICWAFWKKKSQVRRKI